MRANFARRAAPHGSRARAFAATPPAPLCAADMPAFTTGLPAFMSSMSQSAVVSISVAAVTVAGVSVYTIMRASSTRARARGGLWTRAVTRAVPLPPAGSPAITVPPLAARCAVAHKMPATINPEWARATIKYRAAQAQDPISNP